MQICFEIHKKQNIPDVEQELRLPVPPTSGEESSAFRLSVVRPVTGGWKSLIGKTEMSLSKESLKKAP